MTVDGDPDELAPEVRLAVVRTAQEALTNVHKHAPDAEVTISLRCGDSGCELDVRNSGTDSDTITGGALATTGSGYGLVGMRERARVGRRQPRRGPGRVGVPRVAADAELMTPPHPLRGDGTLRRLRSTVALRRLGGVLNVDALLDGSLRKLRS